MVEMRPRLRPAIKSRHVSRSDALRGCHGGGCHGLRAKQPRSQTPRGLVDPSRGRRLDEHGGLDEQGRLDDLGRLDDGGGWSWRLGIRVPARAAGQAGCGVLVRRRMPESGPVRPQHLSNLQMHGWSLGLRVAPMSRAVHGLRSNLPERCASRRLHVQSPAATVHAERRRLLLLVHPLGAAGYSLVRSCRGVPARLRRSIHLALRPRGLGRAR